MEAELPIGCAWVGTERWADERPDRLVCLGIYALAGRRGRRLRRGGLRWLERPIELGFRGQFIVPTVIVAAPYLFLLEEGF